MKCAGNRRRIVAGTLTLALAWVASTEGAAPKAEQALQLAPIQKGVEYDTPTGAEVAQCTVTAKRIGGNVGWVVADANGVILRQFLDTNGDNVVDQWRYYQNGLEVYRDIDSDFNGKADQYRWFHTAGSRWGIDKNEDSKIDAWKVISAEEVTAEIVAALAERDVSRFERVALSPDELKTLGLGAERLKQLVATVEGRRAKFRELAESQKTITGGTKWLQFSGSRPGTVPAGTEDSTKDLRVYENVIAVVQTGDAHGQIHIGTLVEVADGWRVVDVPQLGDDSAHVASGFFFRSPLENPTLASSLGPSEETQQLLTKLEEIDAAANRATSPEALAKYNAERADLLEKMAAASGPADRAMWLRQLADTVSAAAQSGGYPGGGKRLEALFEKLRKNKDDADLAAYVRFRQMLADYGLAIQNATTESFVKIQADWLKQLEQFTTEFPTSPDAPEAMLQLAIGQEYAGEDDEAKKWYGRVVEKFPGSDQAKKAAGARTRLDSVGKTISLRGQDPSGGLVDLAAYRGKVVLVQYWATWCEPCKAHMASLKELARKYGSSFNVVGVNLDSNSQEMAGYLAENRLPWPQIHEEGGLDSRPANEMGILTLPTMILIDQDGKVVNRNIDVAELDRELRRLIR